MPGTPASLFDAVVFGQFRQAAALGAEYEMRLRLLADKTPAIEAVSLDRILNNVEDKVFGHFSAALEPAELKLLKGARGLRNKLLHADFSEARERLIRNRHRPSR